MRQEAKTTAITNDYSSNAQDFPHLSTAQVDVLRHRIRSSIYELIKDDPGIGLANLVKQSDKSYSTMIHHVRQLERADLVKTIRKGRAVHLFLHGTPSNIARKMLELRKCEMRWLAEELFENECEQRMLRAELQARFGRDPPWATRTIQKAERLGLIRREYSNTGSVLCVLCE